MSDDQGQQRDASGTTRPVNNAPPVTGSPAAERNAVPPSAEPDKKNPQAAAAEATLDTGDKYPGARARPAASNEEPSRLLSTQRLEQKQTNFNFFSPNFNDTTFNAGTSGELRRSWAERTVVVQREDCAGVGVGVGDESDPAFVQACEALQTFRIVVFRHQQGCQDRAEKLLKLVSHWASGREPTRKLLGVPSDATLPLSDLASPDEWPAHFHGSLMMLERRKEPMTTRFLSSNNSVGVRSLCQRLVSSDTRLVITLAAEWDAGEGALDPFDKAVRTLELSNATPPERPAPTHESESAFDAIPRLAAGLFEGLGVDEFRSLVNDLAADLDPLPAQAPAAPSDPKSQLPYPLPAQTRHQRWVGGDIDRVVAELGIQYVVSSGDAGYRVGRASGYFLADARNPYGEPGWVIARHPVLLASRVDSLLERYLIAQTSVRFGEAFLALVARLDSAGVKTLSAQWLLDGWQRALAASADVDVAAENLRALVEYLQPGDASADLARAVIDRLATTIVDAELRFQQDTAGEPLVHSLEALTEDGLIHTGRLWEQLIAHGGVGGAAQRMSELQTAAMWALLRLSRRWSAEVARAMAKILTDVSAPATPWRRMAKELSPLDTAPRLAPLTLDHLLKLAISLVPELWTSFARGVVHAFEAPVRDALAKPPAKRPGSTCAGPAALDGQRLAFACLYALAPLVYGSADDERMKLLKLVAPASTATTEEPVLIGRLLAMSHLESADDPALWPAGQGELPATDVVRFLRGVAVALMLDKGLPQDETSALISRLGEALRDMLPLKLRRDLLLQARTSLDAQFESRDRIERDGDRRAITDIKRRIRATQAVIRSLSVPALVPAPT